MDTVVRGQVFVQYTVVPTSGGSCALQQSLR